MNKGTSLQEHPQPFTNSFQNHLAISCNWVAREDSSVWWHAGFLPCMRTLFLQQGQFQSLNSEVMWGSWKLINLQLVPVHLLILLSVLLCILLLLFLPFFCFFFSFFLSVYLSVSISVPLSTGGPDREQAGEPNVRLCLSPLHGTCVQWWHAEEWPSSGGGRRGHRKSTWSEWKIDPDPGVGDEQEAVWGDWSFLNRNHGEVNGIFFKCGEKRIVNPELCIHENLP